MKSHAKVAALNLGMQTVTMAVFERDAGGGLTLAAYERSSLVADPAADSSRSGQLKIALTELKAKLGWKGGGSVACAIPSQGVFARFVKIPEGAAETIGQVLHFEAQQNVPYPIEDVAWSYQVLPEREAGKLGALILATKRDQLEETVEALNGAGLRPSLIETSPIALYNAFRYNYPDAQGCSLLIDLGARATNLIFIEGDQLFIRTLPVGGSSISAALQKRFEGRPFHEIEQYKCAEAFIPPPGNYAGAKDAEAAEAGKIARTVMTRVHNEITRSITFYRTNQNGSAPMRVYLAGGGVSLPYTLEFFNEKLSLPIEFFNPLRRIGIGPAVDTQALGRATHSIGECVGVALRQSSAHCPVSVSLKAPSLERAAADEARRPYLLAAAAALVGALALLGVYFQSAAASLARTNAEIEALARPLQEMSDQITRASAERDRLLAEGADLAALPILRTGWAEILHELNQRQPAKFIWVTKLHPYPAVPGFGSEAGGEEGAPAAEEQSERVTSDVPAVTALSLEGLYLENDGGAAVVDEFVNRLAESPLFDITEENKGTVVQVRATQTGESWAYDYKLLVPLKRPIPL